LETANKQLVGDFDNTGIDKDAMDGIDDIDDNIPDSDVQDLGPDYSKIQRHGQLWRCQPGDTSTMLPFVCLL
jgi:hypothetical protein